MAHIEVRRAGALLDEMPGAYKDVDLVMEQSRDLVETVHTFRQIVNVKGTDQPWDTSGSISPAGRLWPAWTAGKRAEQPGKDRSRRTGRETQGPLDPPPQRVRRPPPGDGTRPGDNHTGRGPLRAGRSGRHGRPPLTRGNAGGRLRRNTDAKLAEKPAAQADGGASPNRLPQGGPQDLAQPAHQAASGGGKTVIEHRVQPGVGGAGLAGRRLEAGRLGPG